MWFSQEAGIRLPGAIDYSGLKFADVPNGFPAITAIPQGGLAQIVAFIGFLEFCTLPRHCLYPLALTSLLLLLYDSRHEGYHWR